MERHHESVPGTMLLMLGTFAKDEKSPVLDYVKIFFQGLGCQADLRDSYLLARTQWQGTPPPPRHCLPQRVGADQNAQWLVRSTGLLAAPQLPRWRSRYRGRPYNSQAHDESLINHRACEPGVTSKDNRGQVKTELPPDLERGMHCKFDTSFWIHHKSNLPSEHKYKCALPHLGSSHQIYKGWITNFLIRNSDLYKRSRFSVAIYSKRHLHITDLSLTRFQATEWSYWTDQGLSLWPWVQKFGFLSTWVQKVWFSRLCPRSDSQRCACCAENQQYDMLGVNKNKMCFLK